MVGPTIQDTIFALHLRFRLHEVALTADIEKMYRQILVRTEDQKYQRVLWFAEDKLITLQSTTVMFGQAPAPFLAIRCLKQLALERKNEYPAGANSVEKDMYVDDLITGVNSIEGAIKIREETTALLKEAGFNIRQWASNSMAVLHDLEEHQVNSKLDLSHDNTLKTLGVFWNAKRDKYVYSVRDLNLNDKITKRNILSEIAKIYDPLGLLGPIIFYAKLIIQKLWKLKVTWDESVPEIIYTIWYKFCSQLNLVNNLSFDRKILLSTAEKIELHGFCDASYSGYGACIYLRSQVNTKIVCKLYCSKSRVAPIKDMTLPRLELNGARLLTQLFVEIKNSIDIPITNFYFWTDSTTVIHWIRTPAQALKTFV